KPAGNRLVRLFCHISPGVPEDVSADEKGFTIFLTLFSNLGLGIMTWWPQPRHLTLKSAPVRITSHSLLPHGCGLRNSTISPRRYLSAIYITIPDRLRFYRKLLFLRSASVVLEICVYLPLADLRLVPLAFLQLCLDILVEYMVPE